MSVRFECSWSYFTTMHWSISCILRSKITFWSQIIAIAIVILALSIGLAVTCTSVFFIVQEAS